MVVVILCLAAAAAGLRYAGPFDARAEPGPVETGVARTVRAWTVPSKYRQMRNPVACDAVALAAAREHWADHCAVCHGNNGSGQTMFGRGMYPKPPDMRMHQTRTQSDGELYSTIKYGVRLTGMPAFGEPGDHDHSSWALVCFIRHLPEMTPEEELAIRAMNPKTEADREEERQEEEFLNGGTPPPVATSGHRH